MMLTVLNVAACAATWYIATFFIIKHGKPRCFRDHFNSVVLLALATGSAACILEDLHGGSPQWWHVCLRAGIAGELVLSYLRFKSVQAAT